MAVVNLSENVCAITTFWSWVFSRRKEAQLMFSTPLVDRNQPTCLTLNSKILLMANYFCIARRCFWLIQWILDSNQQETSRELCCDPIYLTVLYIGSPSHVGSTFSSSSSAGASSSPSFVSLITLYSPFWMIPFSNLNVPFPIGLSLVKVPV